MKFAVLFLICSILFIENSNAGRNLKIELQEARYEIHDKVLIKYVDLSYGIYKKHKVIHFETEINTVVEDFQLRLLVFTPRQKQPIVDLSVNGCEALRVDSDSSHLVKIIAQAIRDGSKMPDKCPIPANERIIIERFYLDPKFFPPFTPEMVALANLTISTNKKMVFSVSVGYEFKKG